jgi:sulfoxide reductase catalytic subunit YedY
MFFRKSAPWQSLEKDITPKPLFLNRRKIIASAGALGVAGLVGCTAEESEASPRTGNLNFSTSDYTVDANLTPRDAVTGYNNFYEFGTDKSDPARHAHNMTTQPWEIEVEGHAGRTGTFSLDDVVDFSKLEERIYRLRCVERWSMVIPWIGVPLADVIRQFEPNSEARYVEFHSYANRNEMRGIRENVIDYPYVEGLRMDEAMNELAFVVVGLYGDMLPNQNGAPVRIIVPWKYGYKSPKSITKIRFVSEEPRTAWNKFSRREYGFYSNVNPTRPHPRWSQATEQVIGGGFQERRQTEMFNGYSDQVAHLYEGMNLDEFH